MICPDDQALHGSVLEENQKVTQEQPAETEGQGWTIEMVCARLGCVQQDGPTLEKLGLVRQHSLRSRAGEGWFSIPPRWSSSSRIIPRKWSGVTVSPKPPTPSVMLFCVGPEEWPRLRARVSPKISRLIAGKTGRSVETVRALIKRP